MAKKNNNKEDFKEGENLNASNYDINENINEIYTPDTEGSELIQDLPSAPILSNKQRHIKMLEGKNFEIAFNGKKIYDSKTKMKLEIGEVGIVLERVKYSYNNLTFRIK